MIRFILPIIFVIISVGLFFGYIDSGYQEIKRLQIEDAQFDEALSKSKELQEIREQLLLTYNAFGSEELDRLQKLLPDNVDSVRLILEIASLADENKVAIGRVLIMGEEEETGATGNAQKTDTLGVMRLSFQADASYDNLLLFLKDLERSLRIVDVTGLGVSVSTGLLESTAGYNIDLVTYWLK